MGVKLIVNAEVAPAAKWVTIGGAWVDSKSGKVSIVFGRQVKDKESGDIMERYPSLVLHAGDKLFLFPATNRTNEKAPTHNLCIPAQDEDEAEVPAPTDEALKA